MPAAPVTRADVAAAAVAALRAERRRLERLGLEAPLARCHHQLRYWEFVSRLLALPASALGEPSWPDASPR
jgi:hypothetical protein